MCEEKKIWNLLETDTTHKKPALNIVSNSAVETKDNMSDTGTDELDSDETDNVVHNLDNSYW